MRGLLLTVALFFAVTIAATAQYYYTPFGHNRIQYKVFDWYYYSTNNFEVYYYPGGQEYATLAIEFLEDEFIKLTDILGYAPYTKTKIFIYNSVHDLQQSNVGIGGSVFTIGGKTDFVKLQVEIAYPGEASEFRKEIVRKLSGILINDMMYGGNLAEIFQNSYLLSLPQWFIDGAARYLAYGWSEDMDDYVREYLTRENITKLVKIQNEEAALIGQSIWNYIALKYGPANVSNILNLTRIIRNEENSISSTLGITYKQFLADWKNYYTVENKEINDSYRAPAKDNLIAGKKNQEVVLKHVKMNAEGNMVAYTSHKNGKYKVNVVNLENHHTKTLTKGGYVTNEQSIDYNLPLIDWKDNETLGVILYKRGNLYLSTYGVHGGHSQMGLDRFREIESFAYNDNGKLAVISGDISGQNDLFLISTRRTALKRITNDLYDEVDPVFIPGTAAVVFSSNRLTDSVKVNQKLSLDDLGDNYNLFLYDLDTTTNLFFRMTNTYSIDRKPLVKNVSNVFYLSDQKGITNIYKYNFMDSTFVQVSDYKYAIQDYDISFGDSKLSFMMLDKGRAKVFVEDPFNQDNRIFTPQTGRQRMQQARFIAKRMIEKQEEKARKEQQAAQLQAEENKKKEAELAAQQPAKAETILPSDSLILSDSFFFEENGVTQASGDTLNVNDPNLFAEAGFVNTENYVFEEDEKKTERVATTKINDYRPESFFSKYKKMEHESRVIGPRIYEPRFSFNNLITSFAIDELRGFSILLETEINDILDNHRLIGGVMTTTNLKSGNIFGEYQFLKYWMDFRLKFQRNVYTLDYNSNFVNSSSEDYFIQKYILNKVEFGAALPISNTFRFELSPFFASTSFNNLYYEAVVNSGSSTDLAADSKVRYGGIRGAMVLDNTLAKGFNAIYGTRALVEYESYVGVASAGKSFSRVNLDLRHYQKIHRDLTLAVRLFYGVSFGQHKQEYLLGGMSNWLFNKFEDQGSSDPLGMANSKDNSDILFTKFVNLRGFSYNEMYGNSALTFSAELRFPVFRYFSNGPISSNFLRNFQMIGFYDVGSAWSGKPPFSRESRAFTKTYKEDGEVFSAKLSTYQNPWLSSYGFGLRTVLLGYYVKMDVAYPVKDFQVQNPRLYFTLGLDF